MNEPYFYANLAHHLAVAGILEPGLWAKLREVAPERLREVLPVEAPASRTELGERLSEVRPELEDLGAWIEAAYAVLPQAAQPLDQALGRVRSAMSRRFLQPRIQVPGLMLDTRPLEQNELLGFQQEIVAAATAWTDQLLEHARKHARNPEPGTPGPPLEPPLPPLDLHRVQRILVLDGERGTGKTALLLSLVKHWKQEQPRTVLPVAVLDFDPRPSGVGTYPWLLTAFRSLARWLDEQREPKPPGPDSSRWSLRATWDEVYRKALLGWNRTDGGGPREDRVADAREADTGWSELRDAWLRFVDDLLKAAEKKAILAEQGLLMLGIDDLDLNERHVRDLLGALRLLSHPRLVVVVTGDVGRLQRVLGLELFREAAVGLPNEVHVSVPVVEAAEEKSEQTWRGAGDPFALRAGAPVSTPPKRLQVRPSITNDVLDLRELKDDARRIADALISKAIPTRLAVPKLAVGGALHLAAALNQGISVLNAGTPAFTDWVVGVQQGQLLTTELRAGPAWRLAGAAIKWLDDPPLARASTPCLTVRAVTLAAGRGRPAQDVFQALLNAATGPKGDPLLEPFLSSAIRLTPIAQIERGDENLLIAEALTVEVWGQPELRLPELAEFAIRIGWPWWAPQWQAIEESPVVGTRLRVPTGQLRLGWPMPKTDLSLLGAYYLLNLILAPQEPENQGPAADLQHPDMMVRFWVWYWMAVERGHGANWRPATPPELPRLLNELATLIATQDALRVWALEGLPLLAAPEHGLGEDSVAALLAFTRRVCEDRGEDWSRLSERWNGRRRGQLKNYLGEEQARAVFRTLQSQHPMAQWYVRDLGRQWYLLRTPKDLEVQELYDNAHLATSDGAGLASLDLFSMPEQNSNHKRRRPLWSAMELTSFLAEGTRARDFLTSLDRLASPTVRRSALIYFLQPWKTLCLLANLPEVGDDFRLTDTSETIELTGRPVELRPRLEAVEGDHGLALNRIMGWTAWRGGKELDWPLALVGWLGQLQTVLWRTSHPADEVIRQKLTVKAPVVLAAETYTPAMPDRYDWLDYEHLRVAWDEALQGLVRRQHESPKARRRYLFINWAHAVLNARALRTWPNQPAHDATVSEHQSEVLVSQFFQGHPLRVEARKWMVDLAAAKLTDSELGNEWTRAVTHRKKSVRLEGPKANLQLLQWAESDALSLHRLTRSRQATEALIQVLVAVGRDRLAAMPTAAQSALNDQLQGAAGPDAWARIQTWMELGGG